MVCSHRPVLLFLVSHARCSWWQIVRLSQSHLLFSPFLNEPNFLTFPLLQLKLKNVLCCEGGGGKGQWFEIGVWKLGFVIHLRDPESPRSSIKSCHPHHLVFLTRRFSLSLLVPAPFEIRQQFLGTRVAVFPDLCFVFFGQLIRAVLSGEVQLAPASTSTYSRWAWCKRACWLPGGCIKRSRSTPSLQGSYSRRQSTEMDRKSLVPVLPTLPIQYLPIRQWALGLLKVCE